MEENYELKSSQEMAAEALEASEKEAKLIVKLSSGALIKAKPLPDNLMLLLRKQNRPPNPPMVDIEQGGKKWREPNPSDPVYLQDMENYEVEIGNAFTELILLAGMEILNLPEGVEPFNPEGDWIEELSAVGFTLPEKKQERRLLWLRYKIAVSSSDLEAISAAYREAAGVSEEDVQQQQLFFRRKTRRGTSSGSD